MGIMLWTPFLSFIDSNILGLFNCVIKKSQVPSGSSGSKFRGWLMAVRNEPEKLISN